MNTAESRTAGLKRALRADYRRRRAALEPLWVSRASADMAGRLLALPGLGRAAAVFIFVSMAGEPETPGIIQALLDRGKRVLVPRCAPGRQMELVSIAGLHQLAPGRFDILEPRPGLPVVPPEAVDFAVLPALACGLDGTRLGQGGGYYDRFMARYDGDHAALCFEDFLADTLPSEGFDRPVGRIVTEARTLELGRADAPGAALGPGL